MPQDLTQEEVNELIITTNKIRLNTNDYKKLSTLFPKIKNETQLSGILNETVGLFNKIDKWFQGTTMFKRADSNVRIYRYDCKKHSTNYFNGVGENVCTLFGTYITQIHNILKAALSSHPNPPPLSFKEPILRCKIFLESIDSLKKTNKKEEEEKNAATKSQNFYGDEGLFKGLLNSIVSALTNAKDETFLTFKYKYKKLKDYFKTTQSFNKFLFGAITEHEQQTTRFDILLDTANKQERDDILAFLKRKDQRSPAAPPAPVAAPPAAAPPAAPPVAAPAAAPAVAAPAVSSLSSSSSSSSSVPTAPTDSHSVDLLSFFSGFLKNDEEEKQRSLKEEEGERKAAEEEEAARTQAAAEAAAEAEAARTQAEAEAARTQAEAAAARTQAEEEAKRKAAETEEAARTQAAAEAEAAKEEETENPSDPLIGKQGRSSNLLWSAVKGTANLFGARTSSKKKPDSGSGSEDQTHEAESTINPILKGEKTGGKKTRKRRKPRKTRRKKQKKSKRKTKSKSKK